MSKAVIFFFVFQCSLLSTRAQNNRVADSLFDNGLYAEAAIAYQNLIQSKVIHSRLYLGTAHMRLGVCMIQTGKYQEAVPSLLHSLSIFEEEHNQERIGTACTNLANLYALQQNYDFAIKYLDRAAGIFNQLKDSIRLAEILNDQGFIEHARGRVGEAIAIHRMALQKYSGQMPANLKAKHYYNLGTCYDQQNTDSSLYYYNLATQQAIEIGDSSLLAVSFTNIGDIFKQKGLYQKALMYFEQSLVLNRDYGDSSDLGVIYHNLSEVYDSLGDYQKAYAYAVKEREINDWLYNVEKSRFASELSEKYESEKKDQTIRTQEAENRLKTRNLLIAILGLFIVALAASVIFYLYRQKKRANQHLTETNERISQLNKKLDHSNQVKSQLFSIISHDIRGPVSSLYAYLQMQKQTTPESDKLRDAATRQTGQLLETLEDLLIWSKSQMNQFEPVTEDIRLQDLFSELELMYESEIRRTAVCLEINLPKDLTIRTDKNMLVIIIRNVFVNAVRNAIPGTRIQVQAVLKSDNFIQLTIVNQSLLTSTEAFLKQAGNISQSKRTGYGLFLVREFLSLVRGTMEFSIVDQAVHCTLTIPQHP